MSMCENMKGLDVDVPRVIRTLRELDLSNCQILINEVAGSGTMPLTVDLYQGQKTGFFLDQTENIRRVDSIYESTSKKAATRLCVY
jgi:23S rRNA (cytosine1962-C5)-methyltransferase